MDKILCAISRCLLGENVRYDGREKSNIVIKQSLSPIVDWLPICPEVEIGLPVPRPPMHLLRDENRIRAVFVHDKTQDFTQSLRQHVISMQEKLTDVDGYIFKARSPSCGIGSVPVFNETILSDGIFAASVRNMFPQLPVIDEEQLADKKIREQFLKSMHRYQDSRNRMNVVDK